MKLMSICPILWDCAVAALPAYAGQPQPATTSHVLLYSDAGFGNDAENQFVEAIVAIHNENPFDFAISAGDNNQEPETGTASIETVFERPFRPLIESGLQIFALLGNHDHMKNRAQEWLDYSRRVGAIEKNSGGFIMPSANYSIKKPDQKWIFLDVDATTDTVPWTSAMAEFAEKSLCHEREQWMMFVIHFPLWSSGPHGGNALLREKLLPVFERCPVDFIVTGHDHLAELTRVGSLRSVQVGNTVKPYPMPKPQTSNILFRMNDRGYAELFLQKETATLQYRDLAGTVRFKETILKPKN